MSTNESKIKESVRTLADTLRPMVDEALKTKSSNVSADGYLAALAAAGQTLETATAIAAVNSDFIAAATLATGEAGIEAMKTDKGLDRIQIGFPMVDKDNVGVIFDRVRENTYTNSTTKEKEVSVKQGATTIAYEVHGARGKVGDLARVRSHLNDRAKEAFGEVMAK
jgi:hypothetical protein